jgi:hypothetical protein
LQILGVAEWGNFDIFIATRGILENQGHIATFTEGLWWLPMRQLLSRIKDFTIVLVWREIIILIGFPMVFSLRYPK